MTAQVAGMDIVGLPEQFTPLSALVVLKYLDENGATVYRACATSDLMSVEALGMAHYAAAMLTRWEDDEE